MDALYPWRCDRLRKGSCLNQLVSSSVFLLKRPNLGGVFFCARIRTYSVLRWEHLRLSLGSWAHPFFMSLNRVLISEPEMSRRSDAIVQHKGQMQAVGKPSLGFNGAKIWPYVSVDYNWLVQPNVDFRHSCEAHGSWSWKAKAGMLTGVDGELLSTSQPKS